MLSNWIILIILSNSIQIALAIDLLSQINTDAILILSRMGFGIITIMLSLNYYIEYVQAYSHLPKTVAYSAKRVAQGLMGVGPICIGVAITSSVMLYTNFRFHTIEKAVFTMF